jgi:hypothetical protein
MEVITLSSFDICFHMYLFNIQVQINMKILTFVYKKRAPNFDALLSAWQRPTLTGGEPPTTIGAKELNFRVRYGNGCDLFAIVTRLFDYEGLFLQN